MLIYVGANDDPLSATYRYAQVLTSEESLNGKDKIGPVIDALVQMGKTTRRVMLGRRGMGSTQDRSTGSMVRATMPTLFQP